MPCSEAIASDCNAGEPISAIETALRGGVSDRFDLKNIPDMAVAVLNGIGRVIQIAGRDSKPPETQNVTVAHEWLVVFGVRVITVEAENQGFNVGRFAGEERCNVGAEKGVTMDTSRPE